MISRFDAGLEKLSAPRERVEGKPEKSGPPSFRSKPATRLALIFS
jgi:hypothetical protein